MIKNEKDKQLKKEKCIKDKESKEMKKIKS